MQPQKVFVVHIWQGNPVVLNDFFGRVDWNFLKDAKPIAALPSRIYPVPDDVSYTERRRSATRRKPFHLAPSKQCDLPDDELGNVHGTKILDS